MSKPRSPSYFRDRRRAKKTRGECYHCSKQALPGTTRCLVCKMKEAEAREGTAP
jgi:hypothetical protein